MMDKNILLLTIFCLLSYSVNSQKQYDMDEYATCNSDINVDDNGVQLNARGASSPSRPPRLCPIYLRSIYSRKDGSNKMQIEVEALSIRDSAVYVDIIEGRRSTGSYIKRLSHRQGSASIIYSQTNEITVVLVRPDVLYKPQYGFRLLIKPWKDRNVLTPNEGKESLSIGAIIGIVFGCLILIAVIILFCWCCCTGRVSGIKGRFKHSKDRKEIVKTTSGKLETGMENKAVAADRGKPGVINMNDPQVWNTVTTGRFDNQRPSRYYQRNVPRNDMRNGGRNGYYEDQNYNNNRQWRQNQYNDDRQQHQNQDYHRDGRDYYRRQRPSQAYDYENTQIDPVHQRENKSKQPAKETLIDDVFESDSGNMDGDVAESGSEDATLQKRVPGAKKESPKSKRKETESLPEEDELEDGSPQLERYKSMDLQSQPDLETIESNLHVNAGVRASVEDDDVSPSNSLRKHKKAGKSPKSQRRGEGGPDPSAMPPEAFDPIFNGPITGLSYPGRQNEGPPPYPGGFMPYGLIPAMHFAPQAAPGTQTYAYAYQTAPPPGGHPAAQGAYIVQNTPTSEGNKRTAFAVEHTLTPGKSDMDGSTRGRRKNLDPFKRNEFRDSGNSKRSKKGKDKDHDLAVITRGAAPPDPGPGHRSVAMKAGTDPDTGIQQTQVVWTDTVPDPTDPKPGDNPQITRKTITRVTTKSGFNELPPEPNSLLDLADSEPAFLSPSRPSNSLAPPLPSAAIQYTPERGNIAFYTGEGSQSMPPERSSTPTSVRHPVSHNKAIRDRIPLDDSTV